MTESGYHIRHLQREAIPGKNELMRFGGETLTVEKWENCLNEVVITRQDVRNIQKQEHSHNARVQKSPLSA